MCILGNPHYWLDPDNGRRVARGIAGKLGEMDLEDAAYFQQRFQDFDRRLSEADKKWQADMKPFHGRKVITYHNSAPNLPTISDSTWWALLSPGRAFHRRRATPSKSST